LLPLAWLGGRKMGADTGLHLFAKKWVRRKSLNQFNMAVIAGAALSARIRGVRRKL
jgi:hypothetical protein